MDIKQLSDIEIKALCYDAIENIETNTNNLKILNAELKSRQKPMNEENNTVEQEVVETPIEETNIAPEDTQGATEA